MHNQGLLKKGGNETTTVNLACVARVKWPPSSGVIVQMCAGLAPLVSDWLLSLFKSLCIPSESHYGWIAYKWNRVPLVFWINIASKGLCVADGVAACTS